MSADHSLSNTQRDKFTTKMKIIALFFVVFSAAVIAASGEMPLTVVNPSVDLTSSSLQRGVQVGKSYYLHNLTFKLA